MKNGDIMDMMKVPLEKDKTEYYFNAYDNTSLYSPLQNILYVTEVGIGILLNLPPVFIAMLGRLFNSYCCYYYLF